MGTAARTYKRQTPNLQWCFQAMKKDTHLQITVRD